MQERLDMRRKLPFEPAATVAVQVDDAWELLTRPDVGLEMTTLYLVASLIDELNVSSFDLESFILETFRACNSQSYDTEHFLSVLGSRRTDDCLPELFVSLREIHMGLKIVI